VTTYQLGPVKAWVQQAGDYLGTLFGIRTEGGWRADGGGFTDHPDGLAVDFMVDSPAQGQALADYVATNARGLDVKYEIWDHRSYNPTRGTWAPYTDTSNPHTDHVHVTFNSTPPVGGTLLTAAGTAAGGAIARTFDVDGLMRKAEGTTLVVVGGVFGLALLGAGLVVATRGRKPQ
jgi:hypothetical protein